MPIRPLPNHPSLEHLRKQAKRLLVSARAGTSEAIDQFREFHPRASDAGAHYSLSDAQIVIARSYGFTSWAALKRHLAEIEPFVWELPTLPEQPRPVDVLLRLACLTYSGWHPGNPVRAARLLADDPSLARADIYTAAALGDVASVEAFLAATPGSVNRKGGPLAWEPLLYACYSRMTMPDERHSTLAVARVLLSSGADANAGFLLSGSYAFTALTGAFGRGSSSSRWALTRSCATSRFSQRQSAGPTTITSPTLSITCCSSRRSSMRFVVTESSVSKRC
jgi:hypothetical protein